MREKRADHVFLAMLWALVAFGFVMLTSASAPVAYQKFHDPYWYVRHQALYGLLPGVILFIVLSRLDYRAWRRHARLMLVVSVVLLLLVFMPGLGATWGTSRSWVSFGGFSLQPSEVVKLSFMLFLAAQFAGKDPRVLRTFQGGLLPFAGAVGLVAVLIMLQPDLGTTLVIAGMAAVVYFLAGAPWSHVVGLAVAGVGAAWALIASAPYRAQRFMTFLHPELDPRGVGYHINQAFLAVGSGGWLGLGLGHSRQKYLYLPEVVGDSIFAVIAEEIGFVFAVALVALFLLLLWRGLDIARRAPDEYGRLLASGIVAWVFFQALFNIGSMVGLMPMTGLPLPFVSYGGTALMVLLAAMGVLTNISRHAGERSPSRV